MHLWKDRVNYEIRPKLQCLFGSFGTPTSIRHHISRSSFDWHSYLPWILGGCGSIHPFSGRTGYNSSLISVKHDHYSIRYPSVLKASVFDDDFIPTLCSECDGSYLSRRKKIVCRLSLKMSLRPSRLPQHHFMLFGMCRRLPKLVIAHHGCKIEPFDHFSSRWFNPIFKNKAYVPLTSALDWDPLIIPSEQWGQRAKIHFF